MKRAFKLIIDELWNTTYWDDEVVAWMPLPEPYKEGESQCKE